MSCCNKIYKYPKAVNTCTQDDFKAIFSFLGNGDYTVLLNFLDSVQVITLNATERVITITSDYALNENYTYTGRIVDTEILVSNVVYDCFEFTTKIFNSYVNQ